MVNARHTLMFGFGESDQRELLQAAFRYAFSLTHHQYDAEDLVQSAWLKLLSMKSENPRKESAVRNRPPLVL
jgi:DNA-directed RNA polymerase specialized sigma24 family protein